MDIRAIYSTLRLVAVLVSSLVAALVGCVVYLHFRAGVRVHWLALLATLAVAILTLAVATRSTKGALSLGSAASMPAILCCGFLAAAHWRRLLDGRVLTRADWLVLVLGTAVLIWGAVTGELSRRRRRNA